MNVGIGHVLTEGHDPATCVHCAWNRGYRAGMTAASEEILAAPDLAGRAIAILQMNRIIEDVIEDEKAKSS